MTKKESLIAEAQKLDLQLTGNETIAQLEKLLKPSTPPEDANQPSVKEPKTSFDVYNVNSALVRTYSVEVHGDDAESLAKEYASKIGGKVL